MILAFRIAFRYLFSKKSTNAINIISWVSMAGMAVGAFALIVVLSVFNGFEGLVLSLYSSFYPDIEVRAAQGKTFEDDAALLRNVYTIGNVASVSRTLNENAYLEYGEQSHLATIKGVDEKYNDVALVKNYVRKGKFSLGDSDLNYAVVGANIGYQLGVDVEQGFEPLSITVPRKGNSSSFSPAGEFSMMQALPVGLFSIQQEFDSRFVFVSLDFAKQLLGGDNRISAWEIKLKDNTQLEHTKKEIATLLGSQFAVKTRYEQKAETYRVMLIERWVTTAILSFIILIISFNIIGSLSMLVLEKSKDISILKAMGADASLIQKIYLLNGILGSLIGAATGLLLGYVVCLAQMKFHFLKLGGADSSFVIDYYPVKLKWIDPIVTSAIIISISLAAAYFPAKKAGESAMSFK